MKLELTVLALVLLYCAGSDYIDNHYYHINKTGYEGSDGRKMILHNNPTATDPTYDELINFIKADWTDNNNSNPGSYVCADYACDLHDNAEKAGIKAGVVAIEFTDNGDGHACNAFNTTDKGLVFVDCTSFDSIVDVNEGTEYRPVPLSKLLGYNTGVNADPLGVVKSYSIMW